MKKILFLFLLFIGCTPLLWGQTDFTRRESRTTGTGGKNFGFTREAYLLYLNQPRRVIKRTKNAQLDPGMARIVLEAHDIFDFGIIGVQMLLDADHRAYADYSLQTIPTFPEDEILYRAFEYKIPVDADPSQNTANVVIDGEETIEIPAGTYDYLILCPVPTEGLVLTNGPFSRYDDFRFEEGYTYRFLVTLEDYPGMGFTPFVHIITDRDAAASGLVLPGNSADLSSEETVAFTVINNGTAPVSGFPVSYQVDGDEPVTETFDGIIQPNDSSKYVFTRRADLSAEKTFRIKAWVSLPGDLVAGNDTVSGSCRHYGIAQLPFTDSFSSEEDFMSDWTVINADKDYASWEYNAWATGPDGNAGTAGCGGSWTGTGDDYLISLPVWLEAGKNHLSFQVKCASSDNEQAVDVRYGAVPDGISMTVIGDYIVRNEEWREKLINFEVGKSGVYYFAFHAKSGGGLLNIDDLMIDSGENPGNPDLAIANILIPRSGCGMTSSTSVGALIANAGTAPVSSVTLSYRVNSGDPVTQTFPVTIEPEGQKECWFDTKADFSSWREYTVEMIVSCEGEIHTDNNTATGHITHFEPVTTLPRTSDFTNDINTGDWLPVKDGSWNMDRFYGYYGSWETGEETALLSRCFTLPEGDARIKITYTGGSPYEPMGFYIAYGKSGTEIACWTRIAEKTEIYTNGTTTEEYTFPVSETDDYSFALVLTAASMRYCFGLYAFTISEVLDDDIAVKSVDYPLTALIPVGQAAGIYTYQVEIENRGKNPATGIKASLEDAHNLFFTSSESITVQPGRCGVVQLSGTLPAVSVGAGYELFVSSAADRSDRYPADNRYALSPVHVSDSVFAVERLTEYVNGTGADFTNIGFGNVYTLNATDTLTSMSVGLGYNLNYSDVQLGVAVYSLKENTLEIDRELFSEEFTREEGGTARLFPMTPRILPPGKYYFELRQLSRQNAGVSYEEAPESVFYQYVDGILQPITGYGNICIRANFGPDAKILHKDMKMTGFTAPGKTKGLYTTETLLKAALQNLGADEVTNLTVYCKIGEEIKETTVACLKPYQTDTVEFMADFTAPGEYKVTVYTSLAGDENTSNDSITRLFTSVPLSDPYIMDFESCDDFDISGEFNPDWRSVDRVGTQTNAWSFFDYPYREEPVGFIAFNTSVTEPAITPDLLPGFQPHSGQRFGAAFCTSSEEFPSDVWLISPQLQLGSGSSLELYVKTHKIEYGNEPERYRILISDTDDEYASFTVLGGERTAPAEEWTKAEADLQLYDGKKVYVAVQYVSPIYKGVVMMVDDIRILTTLSSAHEETFDPSVRCWFSRGEKLLSVQAENDRIGKVEIYNLSGCLVYSGSPTESDTFRLSVSGYEPGVYPVRICTGHGVKTCKIIID